MTGKIMPLRERDTSTVQAAAGAFLSSPRWYANPNTRRGYTGVLDRLLAGLGASARWPRSAGRNWPACWSNCGGRAPRRPGTATAGPWPPGCPGAPPNRLAAPVLPASAERRREHLNATRAVPRPAIERALSRRDVPLREKTLWRMLYETAARASEVLALNIDDPGLDARRALIRSKGGDTEWILHQLRHSAATHLGEQGIPLQLIMAKTRHRNPRTAMRYVRPGAEAVAEITVLLEPPRRRG
jgi:Phage integrase family